jgi:hypothetical protein
VHQVVLVPPTIADQQATIQYFQALQLAVAVVVEQAQAKPQPLAVQAVALVSTLLLEVQEQETLVVIHQLKVMQAALTLLLTTKAQAVEVLLL